MSTDDEKWVELKLRLRIDVGQTVQLAVTRTDRGLLVGKSDASGTFDMDLDEVAIQPGTTAEIGSPTNEFG